MATLDQSQDRLATVRAYALQRTAERRSRGRIAGILMSELPELTGERAESIADRIMDAAEAQLAAGLRDSPDVAAAAVVAFAFGGLVR